MFSAWRGGGVVAPGEYAVTAQSTPNMSVIVAGGRAWIPGTQVANVTGQSFSTQGAYFGLNDAPATVTIATANATNPRIDLIVISVSDAFYSGASNAFNPPSAVTGTPAASPVAPAAPSNSVVLATVAVAANATSITNSNITQTATGSLLTVARGGVDPVLSTGRPSSGLYPGYPIYETDTGRTYVWNPSLGGSGLWDQVGGPAEQYSLSFAAGFQQYTASGTQGLTVFKRGRDCWLDGAITATSGGTAVAANASITVGTLPAAVTPAAAESGAMTFYPGTGTATSFCAWQVFTAGGLALASSVASSSSTAWNASFTGARWRTNN